MPPSETYASGTTPKITDPRRKLQIKEILATKAVSVSGVTGVYSGNGAPTDAPSGSAAIYVNLDNGDFWYWDGAAWA